VPQRPQDVGTPEQLGPASSFPPPDAKTESFFSNFGEPQRGHFVPFHSVERTSTSLS
jgi:hypothetical protein